MKREELQALNLEKETIDKIMEIHQKDDTAYKQSLTAKDAEIVAAKQTIQDLGNKVKAFDGVDVEKLKGDVKDWETKYKADLASVKKTAAVQLAIAKSGVKSEKALKGFLDEEKITLNDDGTLLGFNEQIEAIKKENSYLFESEDDSKKDVNLGGDHGNKIPSKIVTLEDAVDDYYNEK